MCDHITQQLSPDRIGDLYSVRTTLLPPDQPPRYNGAPGQDFSACPRDRPAALLARDPHDGTFERRAVNDRVNSVRNDDPDVLTATPECGLF